METYVVGSFERPKHMFKLMDKKIITILHENILFSLPYANAYCMQQNQVFSWWDQYDKTC